MITNERQYKMTRSTAEKFKSVISEFDVEAMEESGIHPTFVQAELSGLESQLTDLLSEMSEYEALLSMKAPVFTTHNFSDLAEGLIAARIAAGLSQRDLAERMGLKQQQIQRYEADRYANASLSRLSEIAEALDIELHNEIFVPYSPESFGGVLQKLSQVGVETSFVTSKLLSSADSVRLEDLANTRSAEVPSVAARSVDILERVFGWTKDQLFSPHPLIVPQLAGAQARFKMPAGRNAEQTNYFSTYANYLAKIVLEATPAGPKNPIPEEPEEFRDLVHSNYQELSFETVLNLCWDLGIPVVPLRDGGQFHGACWRIAGRNVIVMKQRTPHIGRWLFDLLHELYHTSQRLDEDDFSILESPETSAERRESDEEIRASQFAGEVSLNGRAEELVDLAVIRSNGSVPRLKAVVSQLADESAVDVGIFANYLAFRLQMQGINWWGAAANLQRNSDDPWEIARNVFCQRFSFAGLDETDKAILDRALERN